MPKQQISARVDEELFIAAHAYPDRTASQLVEEGLRLRLDMAAPSSAVEQDHERRIARLEEMAGL